MMNDVRDNDNMEIKDDVLMRMARRVFNIERENSKTNKFGDREMREHIKSIIEEEVKKCY